MNYILPFVKLSCFLCLFTSTVAVQAQAPGGITTGTARGWKVEYFNGTHGTNFNAFGLGGSNTTPDLWGYTGFVSGDEFIGRDADYFGLQYSGILEVPQTGLYSINVYNIDDHATLFIDGVQRAIYTWSGSNGSVTATVNLTAGDHTILLKYIEAGGPESVNIRWSGPGITANSDLDGRFVRVDNAALAAWYNASTVNVTANYSAGRSRVNSFINKAPAFSGHGNISNLGSGWSPLDTNTLNFNPAAHFDGDDWFSNATNQNGLALRSAPRTSFMVNSFISNTTGTSWLWGQSGDVSGANAVGMHKNNGTQTSLARQGALTPIVSSTYTVNEPKLLSGGILLGNGNTASVNNSRNITANGGTAAVLGFTERITNYAGPYGIQLGAFLSTYASVTHIPEFIYYPFELSTTQRQRVNTYMAIKYGITLQHNYLNTSGNILWDVTSNAIYNNRVFGIGRELAVGALNQKQSQSQMRSANGYNFLTVSKGAIAGTNASNTGVLADGDYMILGDDNAALALQGTDIPSSFSATAGCNVTRLSREWKVQTSGNPGPVTIRAGANGAYLFPSSVAGLSLLVDADGDGNFTTGSVSVVPATNFNAGVATFTDVTIPNGAVITFGWMVTAPGGVSNTLALWLKADGELYTDVAGTTIANDGNTVALWRDGSPLNNTVSQATVANRPTLRKNVANLVNFNPVLQFNMGSSYLQTSAISAALNGDITGFSAHKFGGNTSNWNAFMGSRRSSPSTGWNMYVSNTTGLYSLWTATGSGWTQATGTTPAGTEPDLISFSALLGSGVKNLYEKGRLTASLSGPYIVNTTHQFQIGSNGDDNLNFGGNIYEQIVFSSVLSGTDRQKVNTYLAIKYGTLLDQTTAQNYIGSDGTILWNGTTNAVYRNNIFGIGRDDCSGLLQKQSKSSATGDNVVVSIGTIAATNAENTGVFTANRQYILVGHDGAALNTIATDMPTSFAAISCNARRYAREWKVRNVNSTGPVTITIGDAVNKIKTSMTNLQLAVDTDGDGDFTTGTVMLYPMANLKAGIATFNNVSLPDNAVFTLCWTAAAPGGVLAPTSGTTDIAGVPHLNGLAYKFYASSGTGYASPLDLSAVSVMPGNLVSTGYLNNLTSPQTLFGQYATTQIGIEITGKLYVPATSSTYQFRANVPDDQACIKINGVTVANSTSFTSGVSATSGNVTLAAGYHDILIRFGQGGGVTAWDISWNGGSGSTFTAIPNANLFTTFSGPSVWYAADDIQLQNNADGTNLGALAGTRWPDMSANGNDLAQGTGNPLYYNANSTYLRNYNPSVYFTADNLFSVGGTHGVALGSLGKSAFNVVQDAANGSGSIYSGIGYFTSGNPAHAFGLAKNSLQKLYLFTYSNDYIEPGTFYSSATASTNIISGTLTSGLSASLYANGSARGTGSVSNYSTWLANNGTIQLGTTYGSAPVFTGNMNETIFYPWALSTTERQKINSYLAIKWGVTLDQSLATNYLSADGTTTWTGDATFKHDITGIGRDDCSGLNQLQSTATDGADIVTISKGNLAATNYTNEGSFGADKQFVIVGHDNGTINSLNATSMPVALTTITDCYQKLGRVWKVKTTGSVGAVQLQLGKQGLFIFNKSYYKPKLMISSSSTNWTAATIVDADSVINGIVHFSNVNFSGDQYFTVALIQAAPGGVTTNLNLWLTADDGTSTKTDNTAVATWSDLSLQNMHGTGVAGPVYRSGSSAGAANFNPSVSFNGTSQHFTLPTGFNNFEAGTTAFSVLNTNFGTVDAWGRLFHLGTASNSNALAFNRDNASNNIGSFTSNGSPVTSTALLSTTSNPLANTNGFNIYAFRLQAGNSGQANRTGDIYVNSFTAATSTTLATPNTVSRTFNYIGNGTASEFINGYMPEIILYNRDLSATDRNKITSYLAVKYGRTLDVSAVNYLSSNGVSVYNYTTHWNRITAIGRDDCQALEQKQSKSAEANSLVTIGIGSSIATSNETNNNTFSADKSYAVIGDNGKAATWTGVDNLGNALVRLNRIWRIKETGTLGTIYLEVPGSYSALATRLPAGNTPTDPVYLVISNSGNFKTAVTMIEMTPDVIGAATKWAVTHDFNDGEYFTFATKKLCLGPAGITDGLTTWYRADNKPTGTIATPGGTIADETGAHTLTRNASGAAAVQAGSGNNFNYNRFITLTGDAAFIKGALSNTDITSVNEGTMYGVGTLSNSLFRVGIAPADATGVSGNAAFGLVNTPLGTGVNNTPNIFGMVAGGTSLTAITNGTTTSSSPITLARPAGTHILGLGRNGAGTTATTSYNNGSIGEAFSFNRAATAAEQQVLNSYLGIKYGQTINHNYYTADYDGTNAATSTIYDVSTYNNRIFGVGIDSTGCLYQKQSRSQLDGSMLKMSISDVIAPDNITNTGQFALDRTYVAAGDNDGSVAAWITGTTPAIYVSGNCNLPARITRQWKIKAINNQQSVLITIPASTNAATTKLPAIPAGSSKVFMVVNDNADMSINAAQEEIEMLFNTTTNEWEVVYTLPDNVYKYVTFVVKPDIKGLQPVAVATGAQDAVSANCIGTPYIYYRGTTNSTNAIMAVNPNNNIWAPTSITVNNQGTLTGGGGTFTNTGNGYYQSTDGVHALRITKRLHTIVAPGTYAFNDGVTVRLYYTNADTMTLLTDPLPGGASVHQQGWFKFNGNAAAAVSSMMPFDLNGAEEVIPSAWGIEQGVRYVEFLVNSFSSFGYFAKTSGFPLPVVLDYFRGNTAGCDNVLTWKTATETNAKYFDVEVSDDGISFASIGVKQTTGSGSVYQMKHNTTIAKAHYRLKVVDNDGAIKYSNVVTLQNNCSASFITLTPNPATNFVEVAGIKQGSWIKVLDYTGRTLQFYKSNATTEKVNVVNLTQGIYVLEVMNIEKTEKKVFKFIKK